MCKHQLLIQFAMSCYFLSSELSEKKIKAQRKPTERSFSQEIRVAITERAGNLSENGHHLCNLVKFLNIAYVWTRQQTASTNKHHGTL
jgi:hypothetical protein